ncbi:MAG: DNA-3-methyladenine glycosylase 2 family protein [Longimicrobiales bacterium]|nr:DNA-3-methyladenine glycosylase 2 family protein [Longimicrobiales bacterium]
MSDSATEVVWAEAHERLCADPAFGPVAREVGPVRLPIDPSPPFAALARSIVYQQLAGAAARTIHGRVVEAVGGEVVPEALLSTPEAALRGAGLSAAKYTALTDLARRVSERDVVLDDLSGAPDDEVKARLVRVRGVGPWTAEMFLLFTLRRPDVWPVGDLGVRQGVGRVLGWETPPTPRELELIGTGYRPWRSAAAWYAWRALE